MSVHKLSKALSAASTIFAAAVLLTATSAAAGEKLLHSFNGNNGQTPDSSLIFDSSGNLYGTTNAGGLYSLGTVFELIPKAGGGWTEKVLHNFNGKDGSGPYSGLTFDSSGNLYGTTFYGGKSAVCGGGCGTVFELTKASGNWKEKVLHNFNNGTDGSGSYASLIFDSSGNLYGTTFYGGNSALCNGGCGTIFELIPQTGGTWMEKILYSFGANSTDGQSPVASLIFDSLGNLYGVARGGGVYGQGTAFELMPTSGGGWTEKVLYDFNDNGVDGNDPGSAMLFDASGDLYGTTFFGGAYGNGTAFELTPTSGGGWKENILHSFGANGTFGVYPLGLVFDAAGNLYGTTQQDNVGGGGGTIFELLPGGGHWTEKVLHHFVNSTDGANSDSSLILDTTGNLYGTTQGGGTFGAGTVFKIT